MISSKYNSPIGELVSQLRNAGKVATPIPGTPLELLNNTLTFDSNSTSEDFTVADVIYQTNQPQYENEHKSHHCVELAELVKSSSKRVRGLLDLAQNHVNPLVNTLVESINNEYERRLEKVAINLEVVTSEDSPLFKNDSLRSLVNSACSENAPRSYPRPTFFNDFIDNKIEYLSKAIVGLETELAMYLATVGQDNLTNTFNYWFCANQDAGANRFEISVSSNEALVVLLFAHTLCRDKVAEDFISDKYSLGEVRQSLETIASMAANEVRVTLGKVDRREKNKRLIVSYPEVGRPLTYKGNTDPLQIVVDKALYTEFLEIGGSPDLLCGAYIVDQQKSSEELLANKEKYLEVWQRKVNQIKQTNENNKLDIMKRTIMTVIYKHLNDEFDAVEGMVFDRETIINRIETYMSNLSPLVVKNPLPALYHVVSVLIYENVQAEKFLIELYEIASDNPDLDLREAAAIATRNYVVRWVRSQFMVGAC